MTWPLAIFFSCSLVGYGAGTLLAGNVSGQVQLRDSHDPAVSKRRDYSGVVVSLIPTSVIRVRTSTAHVTMLQKDKMFKPHVLAIEAGTTVDFPNDDPIFHNAFSSYSGQIFDVGLYPPGSSRSVRFSREGIVRVFCNIHSSMSAVIVVLGTPYFTVTKRDGSFTIPNVPAGDYELQVFHERATEASLHGLEHKVAVEGPLTLPEIDISEAGFLSMPHKNKYGRDYPPPSDDHSIYPAVRK